jgi:glycosyltransferase involved in cell wall biosynthesis
VRILVLSQYYDPEPIPKPSELAEELAARGHDVSVLTGLPNYPTGRLASGYQLRPHKRETIRGIPVLRVFEVPYHSGSSIGRFLNYGSFMFSAAAAAPAITRPDVVYAWHPPLTVGVAAWALRLTRGCPFVYDVQDIWPDEAVLAGMMREGLMSRALGVLEKAVYKRASHVVVATPGARNNLLAKGVPDEKVSVVPNWIFGDGLALPESADVDRARELLAANGAFTVTFAGNTGLLQGLGTMLQAARILAHRSDIAFRVVGDGSDLPRLQQLGKSLKLTNLSFLGRRPSSEMAAILAASDALLVVLRSGPLTELALPTKTLAYLASARPVLVAAGGAAEQLVRECGAGLSVPPDDPDALALAVEQLAAMPPDTRELMGRRGRDWVSKRFTREQLVDRLEALLVKAAG